jgi:hypothetical protein
MTTPVDKINVNGPEYVTKETLDSLVAHQSEINKKLVKALGLTIQIVEHIGDEGKKDTTYRYTEFVKQILAECAEMLEKK